VTRLRRIACYLIDLELTVPHRRASAMSDVAPQSPTLAATDPREVTEDLGKSRIGFDPRIPMTCGVGLWHHRRGGLAQTVSKGRLTRQELGWLLTQEAQGAAERLRVGVQVLKTNVPPPIIEDAEPQSQTGTGVEASLAALDDVMRMLSSLHPKPATGVRGRRGRIDLATLIWEVAPEARVSIEPGSGTEVFGDEGEIRRKLHVLVGHGSGLGSSVTVKREGDDVRVAVVLGPDSSATAETERAWLSRMATRYGGRLELEGGNEALSLPAQDAGERDERAALQKELDEARKQGEAYARELAAVFAHGEEQTMTSSSFPPISLAPSSERFAVLSRFAAGVAVELRGMLSPIGRDLAALRGQQSRSSRPPPPMTASGSVGPDEQEDRFEPMRRRLLHVQDFLSGLAGIGELDPGELARDVDVTEAARNAAAALAPRVQRNEVEIEINGEAATTLAAPGAVAVMIRELIAQAVGATQRGGKIVVTVTPKSPSSGSSGKGTPKGLGFDGLGTRIVIDDAGPALPASARRAFMGLELDPGTYGRPTSIPIYIAAEIAAWQGALLELGDAPSGGLRVTVTFPR
jgi:signal transduction histidine kinase